ncbi:MAG: ABC transporter permease [bacterium]|nr:ABC transporter permease [bacterium]
MSNLISIARKEFIHIRRDARSLLIIILMPLLQVMLYGYAIDMDVKNIRLGILDQSHTPASRELIRKFTGSDYFELRTEMDRFSQIEENFRKRKIKAALVIPADYATSIQREATTPVQLLIDGSDSNTGSIVLNASRQLLSLASFESSAAARAPLQIRHSIWYNPEQKSSHFIVPGLIAVLMMMICALLTSISITREKETGTLEQILVTPVKPYQIIIGKVIPYVVLATLDAFLVLEFGRILFGVPMTGSPLLLLIFSLIFLMAALALGILISTVARTQQVAMMMALMGTMLPSIMLSGFIFPVASMPLILRLISKAIPATHFLVIIRGILLKGNGFLVLWPYALYLFLLSFVLIAISIKRFKVRLD